MSDSVEPRKPEAPKRSAIDVIKEGSHDLRGTVAEGLVKETMHFEEADRQLLKFHGTYQQDDRDVRKERVKAKQEPKYSFMVRLCASPEERCRPTSIWRLTGSHPNTPTTPSASPPARAFSCTAS